MSIKTARAFFEEEPEAYEQVLFLLRNSERVEEERRLAQEAKRKIIDEARRKYYGEQGTALVD